MVMQSRLSVRYSEAFKQRVIQELESGRFGSLQAANRHYGISGSVTVRGWLRKYGRHHLLAKVVRVENVDEASRLKLLEKQIASLEKALSQTQVDNLLNQAFLELACKQLGLTPEAFKKKVATTR